MSSLKTTDETASTIQGNSQAPSMMDKEALETSKPGSSRSDEDQSSTVESLKAGGDVAAIDEKDESNTLERPRTLDRVDSAAAAKAELERVMSTDEGQNYPTGAKLGLITGALCLSVFLVALDNTIIATAIPKITDQFNSLDDVGWYGSAYLLTTAAFQLLLGKFYSFFSIKYVFLSTIFIFEVGSLVCGVAPTSTALIVGRAIAGIGSSGIFSGALIIIAYSVPLAKRPIYSGLIGAMYGIASVAGPLLGGVFTDKVTWRWCFYINLPIGGVAMAFIIFFFTEPTRDVVHSVGFKARLKQFDVAGTIVFMPAIICLLLALQWGGSKYDWDNARIIVLFILFGVLIAIFTWIQFRDPERATVNPRVISQRSIWTASWYAFCLGSSFFLFIYYIPIWFQAVKGVTALKSGIMNLPMVLSLVICSIVAGGAITAIGYYTPFMIVGSVFIAIGAGLITLWKPDTNHPVWIGYQVIYGIGIGLGMQQPLIAVQTVLDLPDVPTGTAIVIFIQTLGGALFVSVGENVFTNKLYSGLAKYVPTLDPAIVLATGATEIQSTIDPEYLTGVTLAYNDALVAAFQVALAMGCLTIIGSALIEWKSVKGKKIEMAAA